MTDKPAPLPAEVVTPGDIVPVFKELGWPDPGESSEEAELRILLTILEANTVDEVFSPWTGEGTAEMDGRVIAMKVIEPFWIVREDRYVPGLRITAVDVADGEEVKFVTTSRPMVTQAAKLQSLGKLDLPLRVVGVTSANTGRRSYHFEPK